MQMGPGKRMTQYTTKFVETEHHGQLQCIPRPQLEPAIVTKRLLPWIISDHRVTDQ